jgi:hypothetical protein
MWSPRYLRLTKSGFYKMRQTTAYESYRMNFHSTHYLRMLSFAMDSPYYIFKDMLYVFGDIQNVMIKLSSSDDNLNEWLDLFDDGKYNTQ